MVHHLTRLRSFVLTVAACLALNSSTQAFAEYYDFEMYNAEFMTQIDAEVDFQVQDYGYEGEECEILVDTEPHHGWIEWDETGLINYVPAPNYFGFDGFSYVVLSPDNEHSNVVWVYIYVEPDLDPIPNLAPVVLDVKAAQMYGMWRIWGRIRDEAPGNREVQFGGALTGVPPVQCNEDGTFEIWRSLSPSQQGYFTAWTEDEFDVSSNVLGAIAD